MYKCLDYWSRDMLNFDFLEKSLGVVIPPHFLYVFREKCFSCYILSTDQISLFGCLYFLRYWAMCVIAIVCFPGCDVINFGINLIFPIKAFLYLTKFTYLENKNSF